jgi:hypothetical protein
LGDIGALPDVRFRQKPSIANFRLSQIQIASGQDLHLEEMTSALSRTEVTSRPDAQSELPATRQESGSTIVIFGNPLFWVISDRSKRFVAKPFTVERTSVRCMLRLFKVGKLSSA